MCSRFAEVELIGGACLVDTKRYEQVGEMGGCSLNANELMARLVYKYTLMIVQ